MFSGSPIVNRVKNFVKHYDKKILVAIVIDIVGAMFIFGGWWYVLAGSNSSKIPSLPTKTAAEAAITMVTPQSQRVWVDIAGAVEQPGVYQLVAGARLGEGIHMAGGFSRDADTIHVVKELNLSQELKDGDKIYIPFTGSIISREVEGKSEGGEGITKISLNNSTVAELDSLPDIGEKRAEAIVAGRPYRSFDELVAKKIISEALLATILPLITL